MNGQVSKRIRIAAKILSSINVEDYKQTVNRLKKEYKRLPYHMRDTWIKESHSMVLWRYKRASSL